MMSRCARCFRGTRNRDLTEHSVKALVMERVIGIALGYEDLIDHDELRQDPILGAIVALIRPVGRAGPGRCGVCADGTSRRRRSGARTYADHHPAAGWPVTGLPRLDGGSSIGI